MAQRAEPRFLTAITPPPVVKPKAEESWWPAWRYHPTLGGKIFQTEQDFAAVLVGDATWAETPYEEPAKTVPMDLPTAAGNVSAHLALINRLTAENERITERNMQLESAVQDMSPAAEQLKTLQAEFEVMKKRATDAERRIAESQRMKAEIAANKRQQAKAEKDAAPAETLAEELAGTPEPAAV